MDKRWFLRPIDIVVELKNVIETLLLHLQVSSCDIQCHPTSLL